MREATAKRYLDDGVILTALRELDESGGEKRYVRCRFGYSALSKLLEADLVTVDDGPVQEARVWLTVKGRLVLAERGG